MPFPTFFFPLPVAVTIAACVVVVGAAVPWALPLQKNFNTPSHGTLREPGMADFGGLQLDVDADECGYSGDGPMPEADDSGLSHPLAPPGPPGGDDGSASPELGQPTSLPWAGAGGSGSASSSNTHTPGPNASLAPFGSVLAGPALHGPQQGKSRLATVIPGFLYYGGYKQANHLESMATKSITAFLCCAREAPRPTFVQQADIDAGLVMWRKLEMLDGGGTRLLDFLPYAFEFIDECRRLGHRVCVYCAQGYSRSASVVIAYLMRAQRLPYSDALSIARQERRADPNIFFCMQLEDLRPHDHADGGDGAATLPPPAPGGMVGDEEFEALHASHPRPGYIAEGMRLAAAGSRRASVHATGDSAPGGATSFATSYRSSSGTDSMGGSTLPAFAVTSVEADELGRPASGGSGRDFAAMSVDVPRVQEMLDNSGLLTNPP